MNRPRMGYFSNQPGSTTLAPTLSDSGYVKRSFSQPGSSRHCVANCPAYVTEYKSRPFRRMQYASTIGAESRIPMPTE
ncbi:MAG: hypothetical protein ACI93T_000326 [Porticoccaceae bacterium]|jgi:hypothetical protein